MNELLFTAINYTVANAVNYIQWTAVNGSPPGITTTYPLLLIINSVYVPGILWIGDSGWLQITKQDQSNFTPGDTIQTSACSFAYYNAI